jgi:hypothetical protein
MMGLVAYLHGRAIGGYNDWKLVTFPFVSGHSPSQLLVGSLLASAPEIAEIQVTMNDWITKKLHCIPFKPEVSTRGQNTGPDSTAKCLAKLSACKIL